MMNKKVNIYPTKTIFAVSPVIRSAVTNVTKPLEDIRACLIARAKVEEILPDGELVNLNLSNYDKDNATVKEEVAVTPEPELSEGSEIVKEEPVTTIEHFEESIDEIEDVDDIEIAEEEEAVVESKEEPKVEASEQEYKKVDYNKHKNNNSKKK